MGEEEEGFFAGEEAGVFEDADGAADFVVQGEWAFVFQDLSCGDFGHDDSGDDLVVEFFQDFFFFWSGRGWFGWRSGRSRRWLHGAFAVEAADGEVHIFGGERDFFDFAGEF